MTRSISSKYEIILKIGEGYSGIIYKAREIRSNNIVTLKQIKKNQQAFKEIKILNDLKGSSNIIDLINVESDDTVDDIFIIYDYYQYSILDLIHQNIKVSIQQIKSYFKQMLISIETLHSKGYIHRDIKPDNFLLSPNNEIKLIDFGFSIKSDYISKKDNVSAYIVGTNGYIAPEVLLGSTEYGIEVDIWSLGCAFYYILTHEKIINNYFIDSQIARQMIEIFGFPSEDDFPNFHSFNNKELFLNNKTYQKTTIDQILDQKLNDEYKIFKPILIGMLQMNPKKRTPLLEILQNPVFEDTEAAENLPPIIFNELSDYQIFGRTFDVKPKNYRKKIENFYDEIRPLKIIPLIEV